jgi:hypothetical protein
LKEAVVAILSTCACFAQQPAPAKDPSKPAAQKKDRTQQLVSFVEWLAQVAGISAVSGVRGGGSGDQGDIWDQPVGGGALRRLTSEGGYSWPVFSVDDRNIIALRGGDLVSLAAGGGKPVKLAHTRMDLAALIGSGPLGLVVLTTDQVGTFSPESGTFSPFAPGTQEDRDNIARLHSPGRSYHEGQLTLSERDGVITITTGGKTREIATEGVASLQPSASHDLKRVVFIRSAEMP